VIHLPASIVDSSSHQTATRVTDCPAVTQRRPRVRFSGCEVFRDCPVAKSKADEYRDKARECEELAQVAREPLVQQQILEIAEKWRTMAAFEEKFVR
jgi:hypothetical protein